MGFRKIFNYNHLKFGKMKKAKFKKQHFQLPVNGKPNFIYLQTEFIIGKSDSANIMHFQLTKCLILAKFENIAL